MQRIDRFAWQQMGFGTVFATVGIGAILSAFWYMWCITR